MPITIAKIFPPIGIARVGNSPTEFFIGLEIPGDRTPPPGGYKDAQCRIKRQAARFRIFGYDGDTLDSEITAAEADIEWTVHLVHKKAAFRSNDAGRTIDPLERKLTGPNQQKKFDTGVFTMPGQTPMPVPLGEIRADADGRLLVLGGRGDAKSPTKTTISGLYDPEWYDDVSDGPVTATVKLKVSGTTVPVTGAWVIVAPPNFAPPVDNVTTLYDRLFDYQGLAAPATPSFTKDVYPILRSAINISGVRDVYGKHSPTDSHWSLPTLANTADSAKPDREYIFNRLEDPDGPDTAFMNMPVLAGSATLTSTQYGIMKKWKDGNFINDWPGSPPPPLDPNGPVTPDGLTKAALENCVGAAFAPGIEAGAELISNTDIYSEPFRIDHNKKTPGDITKVMSVPWQADFKACTGAWWPAQRPGSVIPQGQTSPVAWDSNIPDKLTMASQWHTLGFVVRQGDKLVQVEKCDSVSVTLLTPGIDFINVPQGPGGLSRKTSRPIIFEIISPGNDMHFQIVSGPAHTRLNPVNPGPFTVSQTVANTSTQLKIWIEYETGAPGESLTDTVRIRNTDTSQEWDIDVKASTVGPKKAAVALVLDRSGSMGEDRGDGAGTKITSLISAAKIFVDVMLQGDGAGIVRYNHNAQKLEDVTALGPITNASDPGRTTIKGRLNQIDLNPSGATSIGDGIEIGRNILNAASGYDVEALVVLTDGKENSPKSIADVAASINSRTYAIGFGKPANTNVAALQNLSGNNGGYLLITGDITGDNIFLLQKYFLQILAGVTNAQIISDPQGTLMPGNEHRIPFKLTEADTGVDVIMLSPIPQLISFHLESPVGRIVDPQQAATNTSIDYVLSEGVSYYRMGVPVELEPQRSDKEGTWHAVLRFADPQKRNRNMEEYGYHTIVDWDKKPIPYSVIVHAYSDLRLSTIAFQKGFEPGTTAYITADISQYDIPLTDTVSFRAEMQTPAGNTTSLPLQDDGAGRFFLAYDTATHGIHRFRVIAEGQTLGGWPFQREQTFSVPVWHGGNQPHNPDRPEDEDAAWASRCTMLGWSFTVFSVLFFLVLSLNAPSVIYFQPIFAALTAISGFGWFVVCKPRVCQTAHLLLRAFVLGILVVGLSVSAGITGENTALLLTLLSLGAGVTAVFGYLQSCFGN